MRPRRLRNEVVPEAHTLPPPAPAAAAAAALPSTALKAAALQAPRGAQAGADGWGEATVPTTFREGRGIQVSEVRRQEPTGVVRRQSQLPSGRGGDTGLRGAQAGAHRRDEGTVPTSLWGWGDGGDTGAASTWS